MKIDIPDELYERCQKVARENNIASAEELIETSIYSFLRFDFEDMLTRCYNRKALEKNIQYALSSSTTEGHNFSHSYLVINIGNFTEYNQTLGVEAGDKLLIHLVMHLYEKYLDASIYRIAGDDFVILLDRFDKAIPQLKFSWPVKMALVDVDVRHPGGDIETMSTKIVDYLVRAASQATEDGRSFKLGTTQL
jgi:diguanylate cyclase (GGDEF)-like protein